MRIAEYKQIDTERIWVEPTYGTDAEGNRTEMITEGYYKENPVMGMVYRDATPEEEAEMLKAQVEAEEMERNRPLTAEERMEILEDAFAELCEEVFA